MDTKEQEEFDKGLLESLDEGLGHAGPTPPADEEPDPELAAAAEAEVASEEEKPAEEEPVAEGEVGEEPAAEAESEEEPEVAAEGEGESEAEEKPEVKADSEEQDDSQEDKDEFGDLPDNVKAETRERFNTLKERFSDVSEELETVKAQNQQWFESIQDTGASVEQYGQALSYLKLINEGTPQSLEQAYEVMSAELQAVGKALGKEAPGLDPLADYDDLQKRVDEGYLDRKDALEIASARSRQALQDNQAKLRQQQNSVAGEEQQAVNDLREMGTSWKASDPHYDQKLPALKAIIQSASKSGVPPKQWPAMVRAAYAELPNPETAPAAPKPAAAPNPIKKTPAGGNSASSKQPGSLLEAVDLSLGQMG